MLISNLCKIYKPLTHFVDLDRILPSKSKFLDDALRCNFKCILQVLRYQNQNILYAAIHKSFFHIRIKWWNIRQTSSIHLKEIQSIAKYPRLSFYQKDFKHITKWSLFRFLKKLSLYWEKVIQQFQDIKNHFS